MASETSSPLNGAGFYLRHGYVEGELNYVAFTTLFSRQCSANVERLTREHLRQALFSQRDASDQEEEDVKQTNKNTNASSANNNADEQKASNTVGGEPSDVSSSLITEEEMRLKAELKRITQTIGNGSGNENSKKMSMNENDSNNNNVISPLTKLLHNIATVMDPATEGQDMFRFLTTEAQQLWRIVENNDNSVESSSTATSYPLSDKMILKATIPIERAKLWKTLFSSAVASEENGGDGDDEKEKKECSETATAANANAIESDSRALIVSSSENETDQQQSIVKPFIDKYTKDDGLEPSAEVRTTVSGVAAADPSFVTLTISDGQGLRAWLFLAALYSHNELERMKRSAMFDAKKKLEAEFDRSEKKRSAAAAEEIEEREKQLASQRNDGALSQEDYERLLSQIKLDAAVADKDARSQLEAKILAAKKAVVKTFIVPPRSPLVLTVYDKVREQRVLFTDDVRSGRCVSSRSHLIRSLDLVDKLFCGGGAGGEGKEEDFSSSPSSSAKAIVLRNTKNDNILILPSPLLSSSSSSQRVSWGSLVAQCRHAWRVQRPYFQYVLVSDGLLSFVNITTADQFAVWKKQLAMSQQLATSPSPTSSSLSSSSVIIPFELRVYEHADEKDIINEPLPRPIEIGIGSNNSSLLGLGLMQPPFFLPTGAVTRGVATPLAITDGKTRTMANNDTHLETRAAATAAAHQQNSYRQLHGSLSLQTVNILNRIEAYNYNHCSGNNIDKNTFVSSWDKVSIDEAREKRMAAYNIKQQQEQQRHVSAASPPSSSPSTGVTEVAVAKATIIPRPPQRDGSSPTAATQATAVSQAEEYSSDINEARALAAAHKKKLAALLAAERDDEEEKGKSDENDGSKKKSSVAALPPIGGSGGVAVPNDNLSRNSSAAPSPLKSKQPTNNSKNIATNNNSINHHLTPLDLTSPYRVTIVQNGSPSAASSDVLLAQSFGYSGHGSTANPFGPKYTIPSLHHPQRQHQQQYQYHSFEQNGVNVGGKGDDSVVSDLTAAQRHLQRLTKNAQIKQERGLK